MRLGLEELKLCRHALAGCVHFNDRAYQRNLIHFAEHYEVLVLCWRSGQHSPIHDHGESTCCVLVVEGVATEATFQARSGKGLVVTHSRDLEAGHVMVSRGGDIHQVSNEEPHGVDLVSLHVYSPRLRHNRTFRIDGTERVFGPHALKRYPKTILAPLGSPSPEEQVESIST
jgi:cysteine dioxygenase